MKRLRYWLGRFWAAPNTMLGILIGCLLGGRFAIVDGVIEIHGPRLADLLKRLPVSAAALTLGHVVLGQDESCLNETRPHERVHVAQYESWGPFFLPAYFTCSLVLWCLGRDWYRQNPFELAAYEREINDCQCQDRPIYSED